MSTSETLPWKGDALVREVEGRCGTAASACFQCHKCSTGCPIGPDMDLLPSQVMRLVNFGDEEVLQSRAIWLCASCEACTTRCPMEIDVAAAMDALRMMAIDRQVALPDKHGTRFNRSFLGSVRRHGRVYELGMMMAYKLRTGELMADSDKALAMWSKRKLKLLPNRSAGRGEVREVFRRAEELKREEENRS
jgi:heterodisulfide reductase subunit C